MQPSIIPKQEQAQLVPHVRPRFRVVSPLTKEDIEQRFQEALEKEDVSIIGRVNPGFISLFIPHEDQHYWSPQLNITLEHSPEEGGRIIRGLYGPRPAVWTMFVFFYFFLGLATVFVTIIGLSNITLGQNPWQLWLALGLVVLLSSIYAVSRFGERLGRDQMVRLHNFTENVLGIQFEDTHD
ncbi:hypothetical protein [Lewinella sp. W8]|uniref:hypothetical protein n=1 Tax=Lewinella sp. W8 TaxID=2528208 RepID=UPI0010686EBD|nr:hypothetical protein [Lewinella sp. W8]MTB50003.1 hypothetical protein [Lewinella sp. W8]